MYYSLIDNSNMMMDNSHFGGMSTGGFSVLPPIGEDGNEHEAFSIASGSDGDDNDNEDMENDDDNEEFEEEEPTYLNNQNAMSSNGMPLG